MNSVLFINATVGFSENIFPVSMFVINYVNIIIKLNICKLCLNPFHSINASGILQFVARVYSLNEVGINMVR